LTRNDPKNIASIPARHRMTSQLTPLRSWIQNGKWLSWTVLVFSFAATYQLWRIEQRNAFDELKNHFDFQVREDILVIEQRMRAYEQVLRGAEALFASSRQVESGQFVHYVATLHLQDNYPGIQGMSFARLITPKSLIQPSTTMRRPATSGNTPLPDTTTKSYIPITYREFSPSYNTRFFSFDAYSEPFRRAAMEQARDEGKIAISGKVRLLPKGRLTQNGFVMYLPIYKNGFRRQTVAERRTNLIGWVTAPFMMDDLMATKDHHPKERDIEIYDGEKMSNQTLLFDTDGEALTNNAWNADFKAIRQVRIADHTWTIAIRSLPAFEARLNQKTSQVVASSGLGISLLLALLSWLLVGSRSRAIEVAHRMNRELIEREMRYRQMFENNASIAVLIDPASGSIIDANPAAEAFWGYPLPQLRCMNIREIDTASPAEIHAAMQQAKNGLVACIEQKHRLKNGEIRDVEIYSGPLTYQGKTLLYSLLHDITGRKQAEDAMRSSEERYRLIADNTGDVIWMMDVASFSFTYISPSIERQRGFTSEEIIARHKNVRWSSSPSQPQADSMFRFVAQLQVRIQRFIAGDESQRREVREINQPHKNGSLIPIEVVSTLLCNNQGVPVALVGVSRDISARRQAQEEQKRFMAMVSHEFRTPLATIDGAIQRLEATAGDIDAATSKRYGNIQRSVDRLTALLDDYLTQDRMDILGQGLHLHFFPPQALLLDSQASAQALSTEHVITVEVSRLPDTILCDADRLRLTLHVLSDNAVKYTPPGSQIRLCASAAANDGIEFLVIDNGPGILEDEVPHLFTKFFRGRHSTQQTGSGLGLYLARSVVELHGGTLTARNRAEGGAEFRIWLPSRPAIARA
jgi:PAS domain S-box-containing protein